MRTDRQGRDLQAFLTAVTGQIVETRELVEAVGLTPAKYYGRGNGRSAAEDFPNPMELKAVADHYGLGKDGYGNLLAEFDYLDVDASTPGFSQGALLTRVVAPTRARTKQEIARSRPALG